VHWEDEASRGAQLPGSLTALAGSGQRIFRRMDTLKRRGDGSAAQQPKAWRRGGGDGREGEGRAWLRAWAGGRGEAGSGPIAATPRAAPQEDSPMELGGGRRRTTRALPEDLGSDRRRYLAWAEGEAGEAPAVPMDMRWRGLGVGPRERRHAYPSSNPSSRSWRKSPRADLENYSLCECCLVSPTF